MRNTGYQHCHSSLFSKGRVCSFASGKVRKAWHKKEVIVYIGILLLEQLRPYLYNCIFFLNRDKFKWSDSFGSTTLVYGLKKAEFLNLFLKSIQ